VCLKWEGISMSGEVERQWVRTKSGKSEKKICAPGQEGRGALSKEGEKCFFSILGREKGTEKVNLTSSGVMTKMLSFASLRRG